VLVGRTTSTLGGGNGALLQIGSASTSASGAGLTIHSGTAGLGDIQFADGTTGADSYRGLIRYEHSTDNMNFRVNATEAMRIDSSGRVNIGPRSGTDGAGSFIPGAGAFYIQSGENQTSTTKVPIIFSNIGGSSESMRIDSSGNLLVGTTSRADPVQSGGTGVTLGYDGFLGAGRDDTESLVLNRNNSDGDIALFRKDGSTVGSIGSYNGSDLYIGDGEAGVKFSNSNNSIIPWNTSTNASRDNNTDLGGSSDRFRNLYLSGGVVFGATGGAVTSKTLDDYEEGTWTPQIWDASSGGNQGSTTNADGKYVKVGNLVTITFRLQDIVTTGMTSGNTVHIRNLPFSAPTTQPVYRIGNASIVNITLDSSAVSVTGYVYSTYIVIEEQLTTGVDLIKVSQISSGTGDMYVSATYQV